MKTYRLRRRTVRGREGVQLTIGLPAWLDSSYAEGQTFTVDQLVDGRIVLSPVVGVLQPPVTVKRDGRSDPRGKLGVCPVCGKEVDRRGMKNHVAWVHRGVVPAWRKAKSS